MREQHASFLSEMAERYSAQERRQEFMTQAAASMSSDVSITRALADKIVRERTKDVPVNTFRAGDFNMFVNKYYHDHGPMIAEMNLNHEKLRKQLMQFFERRQTPPAIADDKQLPDPVGVVTRAPKPPPPPPGAGGSKIAQPHLTKKKKPKEILSIPRYTPPDIPDLNVPEFIASKHGTKRKWEGPDPKFKPKRRLNPPEEPRGAVNPLYTPGASSIRKKIRSILRGEDEPPLTGKRKESEPAGSVIKKPRETGVKIKRQAVHESGLRKPQARRAGSSAPLKEKPKVMRSVSQPMSFYIGT
jgi:hypothetical protein